MSPNMLDVDRLSEVACRLRAIADIALTWEELGLGPRFTIESLAKLVSNAGVHLAAIREQVSA